MKVLFFSPFANIWEHAFPESLLADGLKSKGVDVVTVRCDGLFQDFCVAMSASGLTASDSPAKKKQVCKACRKRRDYINREFSFDSILLESYLSPADRSEADDIAASASLTTWTTISLRGVPIGRYAAYEFLLNYKILGTNIPAELFEVYRKQLRNSCLALLGSFQLLAEQKPDRVITYNRLYGVNHAFLAASEAQGIPTYSLQGGGHVVHRGETMTMFRDSQSQFQVLETQTLRDFMAHPISKNDVALVSSHFQGLMLASSAFAYSSAFEARDPDELRSSMGIRPDSKVVLIPMSSEDELNAAELADLLPDRSARANVFDNQFEWIGHVFSYAKTRPQTTFVLRLHPRMYPNKRENVVAPVVQQVIKLVETAPENVIVNYPSDAISLYDLLQIVDVCLGFRSTVGAEMAAYGIPVVAPANRDFYTYPDDLQRVSDSTQQFDRDIDEALSAGWSVENMRSAYRWFAFLFTRIAVDFSESVNAKPIAIRPKKPGLKLWLWRKMVFFAIQFGPLVRERIAMRNRTTSAQSKAVIFDVLINKRDSLSDSSAWPSPQTDIDHETSALRDQLNALVGETWTSITATNSLTGRIRAYLSER